MCPLLLVLELVLLLLVVVLLVVMLLVVMLLVVAVVVWKCQWHDPTFLDAMAVVLMRC